MNRFLWSAGVVFLFSMTWAGAQTPDVSVKPPEVQPAVPADPAAPIIPESPTPAPAPAEPSVAVPETTPAETPEPTEEKMSLLKRFWCKGIHDHLEAGIRAISYDLKTTHRGSKVNGEYVNTFIGSINDLQDDQSSPELRFYAQYRLCPGFALGISHDTVKMITRDGPLEINTDGNLEVTGPMAYAQVSWIFWNRLQPFAELGYVWYTSDFQESAAWSDGGIREMRTGDSSGPYWSIGLALRVVDRLYLEAFYRQIDADAVTVDFYRGPVILREGDFPVATTAYGVGLKYAF